MTRRDQDALGVDGPENLAAMDALDAAWDRLTMTGANRDLQLAKDDEAVVHMIHSRQHVPVRIARRVWGRASASRPGADGAANVSRVSRLGSGQGKAPGLVAGKVMPGFELVAAALILMVIGGLVSGGGRMPGMGRFGSETASAEAVMLPAATGPVATPSGDEVQVLVIAGAEKSGTPDQLLALDPITLADAAKEQQPPQPYPGGAVILSADGSTRVELFRSPAFLAGGSPDTPTEISVRDAINGSERTRITFPYALISGTLSADGTRLIGVVPGTEERPQTWFVIPLTANTTPDLVHVEADAPPEPSFRFDKDDYVIDADARYLYRLITLGSARDTVPRATQLAVADLTTGTEIARLDLPVVAGPYKAGTETDALGVNLRPAIAMAPSGTRLAIVHGDAEAVTTVAIEPNGIPILEGQMSLTRSPGVMRDYTGDGAFLLAEFGEDDETLYVFGRILRQVPGNVLEFPMGIRRIDLARGEIVAEGVTDRVVMQAFGTGTGVYVSAAPQSVGEDGTPFINWKEHGLARLNPSTLSVEAERTFPDNVSFSLFSVGGS